METINQIWKKVCDSFKMRDFLILFVGLLFFTILSYFGFKIEKNAYFYTLSTISQTLAALIGIIAIFVIFKLEALKKERINNFRYLNVLFDVHESLVNDNCNKEPYKDICAIVTDWLKVTMSDDIMLKTLSDAMGGSNQRAKCSNDVDIFIGKTKVVVDKIIEIDVHIREIPGKFIDLTKVVLCTIILSILALPLGWFIVPIGILSSLSILKLPAVAFIVYLSILSIYQSTKFLDSVIKA